MRLSACGCQPTAYAGGSATIVHSQICVSHPEQPLDAAEMAEWRGHPAGTGVGAGESTRLDDPAPTRLSIVGRFYNGKPRNERTWIHNGWPGHYPKTGRDL